MRVAILSCGPSLRAFPGRHGFGVVVGVNRAATAGHRCDWWSVGDAETVGRLLPGMEPLPRLWTHHDTYRRVVGHHGWVEADLYERDEQKSRWSMFSATAALWLAKRLGAVSVECWGCDMFGKANWDGTPEPTANRSAERWTLEGVIWEKTRNVLEEHGIEVIRHGPVGSDYR